MHLRKFFNAGGMAMKKLQRQYMVATQIGFGN